MSRKRQLKKERARVEELDRQIERLAGQGADDALLELAQGRAVELSPSSLEICTQAADRALRRALAEADLPRVQRLLRWIGRGSRSQPPAAMTALAEAVMHLAEGRLAEARAGVAAVGTACPSQLAAALTDLCSEEIDGLETPGVRAVQRLRSALDALPERAKDHRLQQALAVVAELRAALPAAAAACRLLDTVDEALRLLAELAGVEQEMRRWKGAGLTLFFLDRTRACFRRLLPLLREAPPAALLRPLHHALRLRWRRLLEIVAERDGPAAWAGLHTAAPALFSLDLEVCGGLERLRTWTGVRELHEAGKHRRLATLLGSMSAAEKVPERMVRLWSLELWAWEQASALPEEDEPALLTQPPVYAALARLERMAGEIAARVPAEQRSGAARFLRVRLVDLCETQLFGSHTLKAAETLLRHLPDDPGLLAVALAGAVCSQDGGARARLEARIAARGKARSTDREILLRLADQIADEEAELAVGILLGLRPLFDEVTWPEILDTVLQSFIDLTCSSLSWDFDGNAARFRVRDLEAYRAALGERPGFAALDAALACLRPGGKPGALREALERSPELETALIALRVLSAAMIHRERQEVEKGLDAARDAAIARLDLRWRLWWPLWPLLALEASPSQQGLLRSRLLLLLCGRGMGEEDRKALERALRSLPDAKRETKTGTRTKKKAKRRNAAQGRFNFDLF